MWVNSSQRLVDLVGEHRPTAAIDGKRVHVPAKLQFAHGGASLAILHELCGAAFKCSLACGSRVLLMYLCFVFALYERKNETQTRVKYRYAY